MSTVYRADSDNGANQTLTNVLHNSSSFDIDSTDSNSTYSSTDITFIDVTTMQYIPIISSTSIPNVSLSEPELLATSTTTVRPKGKSNKKGSKRKPNKQHSNNSTSTRSRANNGHSSSSRRKKPTSHQQNRWVEETVPEQDQLKPEHTCLIGEVCMRNGKLGYCYKPHSPIMYNKDSQSTEDFYDMMLENCGHFFDNDENLRHPLCCSPEQEETIARLNANIDLIRRSCPSCLVNVKKLFCNLFCAPNQRDFVRVDRIKGETVMEVTYAMSEQFVQTFFSSCQDVRVFGAYLLDYEYGCGKLKRANCTAVEFMRSLGGLSEIPFNFRPLIIDQTDGRIIHPLINAESDSQPNTISMNGEWPNALMNDTGYRCDQAAPNMSPCQCDHCPRMCSIQSAKQNAVRFNQMSHNSIESTIVASNSSTLFTNSYSLLLCFMLTLCMFPFSIHIPFILNIRLN
ncbi:hypothetical protein RDWZM_008296 [Blomia tropicalis]|uniref:Niemann-Pick C1 N-terminal domain-containing protein n=1 Tax=Blomia tropicalis TaxID=40697 RepID=A0A9Q0M144_BLOTA|nr:hypothetical protein RDWZM_008296 [Blomia tropicalis]